MQFLTKYWTYILLISIICFFITIRLTFNKTMDDHHLEPLFYTNSTHGTLVRINPNFFSNWISNEDQLPDSTKKLHGSRNATKYCSEIPSALRGKILLILEPAPSFKALQDEFANAGFKEDGHYQPVDCIASYRIAIVVPYRDRYEHLNIFLRNIHPFLQRQRLDYTIFVVEQADNSPFNRGMLMNIGFVEAMKIRHYDCIIFHDVDLLPEDDRNLYTCPEQPRHMSVAIDVFRYKLPYGNIFGGVSAMSAKHFQMVNGFSNTFWGWGGEDDDMSMRIKMKGLHLARYPFNIAKYTMLPHEKQKANPSRFGKLFHGRKRFKTEGLNSLEYRRIAIRPCKLFLWIFVELIIPSEENTFLKVFKNTYLLKLTRI